MHFQTVFTIDLQGETIVGEIIRRENFRTRKVKKFHVKFVTCPIQKP